MGKKMNTEAKLWHFFSVQQFLRCFVKMFNGKTLIKNGWFAGHIRQCVISSRVFNYYKEVKWFYACVSLLWLKTVSFNLPFGVLMPLFMSLEKMEHLCIARLFQYNIIIITTVMKLK